MAIRSLQDALRSVKRADADVVSSSIAFYGGDHWQQSKGWAGPVPEQGNTSDAEALAEIKHGFVLEGVLGREPSWNLTVGQTVDEATPLGRLAVERTCWVDRDHSRV